MIEYKTRNQIDDIAWNNLVENSANGLVYANTFFLDALSPGWSALVYGNYETVMPLTTRKKYGVDYLYQPAFLQQLGVFGITDQFRISAFLIKAKQLFKFAEIHLNFSNQAEGVLARKNFVLPLHHSHASIASAYSNVHVKNLKRANNAGLRYLPGTNYQSNIQLNYDLYGRKIKSVKKNQFEALIKLTAEQPAHFLLREVRKNDSLQASTVCFRDARRIYFVMSSVTEEGRKNQANHFLVDQMIQEFSGLDLLLDFEGSDIPGIADFYLGFGARDQPYYFQRWNNLSFPYNLLKK